MMYFEEYTVVTVDFEISVKEILTDCFWFQIEFIVKENTKQKINLHALS